MKSRRIFEEIAHRFLTKSCLKTACIGVTDSKVNRYVLSTPVKIRYRNISRLHLILTISANNFDDEPTLGFSRAILNNDITFFNTSVFLSGWVNSSTFEDRDQSLELGQQVGRAIKE